MPTGATQRPRVAAVVVTYQAADTVAACLTSVPDDVSVVVVDNRSTDATVAVARRVCPRAEVLVNPDNRGFATAAHQGLVAAAGQGAEFGLLLNPDAELDAGAVDLLVAFADAHPAAAVVSPLVVDISGRPEPVAAGAEPTLMRVVAHELGLERLLPRLGLYQPGRGAPERRAWVAGTCLLVRVTPYQDVGGFDRSYFLYCEDIDLCRRLRDAGWEVWVAPPARARHHRSRAVRTAGAWVDRHRIGSLDSYYARGHGGPRLALFRVARVAGAACRAVAFGTGGVVLRRSEWRARAAQRSRDARLAYELLRRGGHGPGRTAQAGPPR